MAPEQAKAEYSPREWPAKKFASLILHEVSFFAKSEYEFWIQIRNQLMLERSYLQEPNLVKGCLYLCSIIKSLAEWGISQDFEFDGFTKFDSIDLSGKSIADPKSEKEFNLEK